MAKICPRCGYERKDTDQAPITDCPQCGVIYDRFESQRATGQALAADRIKRMQRDADDGARGVMAFVGFRWLLTPVLVRVSFAISVVILGLAFVGAVLSRSPTLALLMFGGIVASRIVHECIIVVFRVAEDISDIRQLTFEQARIAASK